MSKTLKPADREMLDELHTWCGKSKPRLKFLESLMEYFDLTSIVLIVRALIASKVLP